MRARRRRCILEGSGRGTHAHEEVGWRGLGLRETIGRQEEQGGGADYQEERRRGETEMRRGAGEGEDNRWLRAAASALQARGVAPVLFEGPPLGSRLQGHRGAAAQRARREGGAGACSALRSLVDACPRPPLAAGLSLPGPPPGRVANPPLRGLASAVCGYAAPLTQPHRVARYLALQLLAADPSLRRAEGQGLQRGVEEGAGGQIARKTKHVTIGLRW